MPRTEQSNKMFLSWLSKIIGTSWELQRELDQDQRCLQEIWIKRIQWRNHIRCSKWECWVPQHSNLTKLAEALLAHSREKIKRLDRNGVHNYLKVAWLKIKKRLLALFLSAHILTSRWQSTGEQVPGWSVSLPNLRARFCSRILSFLLWKYPFVPF